VKDQKVYSPAGGRSPSGLSRRRAQFYGPPPSFFKNGGWRSTGKATPGGSATSSTGGFGIGGVQSGRNDDVPHFDFERHKAQQERRRRPVSKKTEFYFANSGIIVPLIGVGSLLIVAVAISLLDARVVRARKQSNDRQ